MCNVAPTYSTYPSYPAHSCHRFLPKFQKKKQAKRRQPYKTREKKPYTPFPPPQLPSKVDLAIESGEYFLPQHVKEQQAAAER